MRLGARDVVMAAVECRPVREVVIGNVDGVETLDPWSIHIVIGLTLGNTEPCSCKGRNDPHKLSKDFVTENLFLETLFGLKN